MEETTQPEGTGLIQFAGLTINAGREEEGHNEAGFPLYKSTGEFTASVAFQVGEAILEYELKDFNARELADALEAAGG